jgi:putative membrane protein
MIADALLAYLHYTAVFIAFAFLSVEVMLARQDIDARAARLLARCDRWYLGAALTVLITGLARVFWGVKGVEYYSGNWLFWAKLALFVAVVLMSIAPARAFVRWSRAALANADYMAGAPEQRRIRRILMIELHLLALLPLAAVFMARGAGM